MTVKELKKKIEDDSAKMKEHSGAQFVVSETAPVGFGLLRAVADILEQQQREIDQLKRKVAEPPRAS